MAGDLKATLTLRVKDSTKAGIKSAERGLHELSREAAKSTKIAAVPFGTNRQLDLQRERAKLQLRDYRKSLQAELSPAPLPKAAALPLGMNRGADLALLRQKVELREYRKGLMQQIRPPAPDFGPTRKALGRVKSQVGDTARFLGKAFLGIGVIGGLGVAKLVKTGGKFEQLRATLAAIEGSSKKASESFDWIDKFSSSVPFSLEETTDAFIRMRNQGMDPTNGSLRTFSDTAAVFASAGKRTTDVVEAMADAVTGENERLKEFGIKANAKGKYFAYTFVDKQGAQRTVKALKKDRKQIQDVLTGIFSAKYAGASDKISKTLPALLGNIGDELTKFQSRIFSSGIGDGIKGELEKVYGEILKMKKDGRLDELASSISSGLGQLFSAGKRAFSVAKEALDALGGVKGALKLVGIYAGTRAAMGFASLGTNIFNAVKALQAFRVAQAVSGIASVGTAAGVASAGVKGLMASLGPLIAAGGAGYAFGTWLQEKFDLANGLVEGLANLGLGPHKGGKEGFTSQRGLTPAPLYQPAGYDMGGKGPLDPSKDFRMDGEIEVSVKVAPGVEAHVRTKQRGNGPPMRGNRGAIPVGAQ